MADKHDRLDTQLDFSELFFTFFQRFPKGVRYAVRHNCNLRHDLQFVSSLIHDAKIKLDVTTLGTGNLCLPIVRDRWELFQNNSLSSIKSNLFIGEVSRYSFTVESSVDKSTWPKRCVIRAVDCPGIFDRDEDVWSFLLIGNGWTLGFELPRFGFRIEVIDGSLDRHRKRRAIDR